MKQIKVIDLFAGPGGLGEGFASHDSFKIAISIEKEESAHKTLTLRAFVRQFDKPPPEYYQFLRGELGRSAEEQLYKIPKFKQQVERAKAESRCLTLGEDNDEIQKAIDNAIGKDQCILIGGPPCQAYSLAGRSRNQGIKDYTPETDKRNFLYLEYLNIIARYQPMVFVMENVKGMLSAKIHGEPIFNNIRTDLRNPCKATGRRPQMGRKNHGYRIVSLVTVPPSSDLFSNEIEDADPRDYIIRSELMGVPQRRHRVIVLGLREDIEHRWDSKSILKPSQNKLTTIKDVIRDLPEIRSGLSKEDNTPENWTAIVQKTKKKLIIELRKNNLNEVAKEISRLKIPSYKQDQGKNIGLQKTKRLKIPSNHELGVWYSDKKLGGYVLNHESRGHIEKDLERYLFCAAWAKAAQNNKLSPFPKSQDYPNALKPKHKNFDSGHFSDRFRVQIEGEPATTITSHISKDGHYFIHYDPKQCRSLTVREAARAQTFPDNYFFEGNRTQQYVQVGNAVPPFLAFKISKVIASILK